MTLKIAIAGAGGRMGRQLIQAVHNAEGAELGVAFERKGSSLVGADAGELAGIGTLGIKVSDDLNAEKVTEIILVSPPYKKRITDRQEIEEFTSLFNERKKKPVFSIINSSGWSKRAIITTETYQYDIIFCGENITVNRQKYVMDESIDSELEQFYQSLNETE